MDPEFVAILQKLVAERGKEILLNTAKCKALLSDYTRNEHKKESRLLLQALDTGVQKAIDTADNITICKLQQVRILSEDYSLAEEKAEEVVDTLALVLRGDTTKTEILVASPQPTFPAQTASGIESVTGLANKLAWLQTNAQSNGSYVIDINADESIGPQTLSYSGRSGITITLRGLGSIRTISLSSNGSLFTVESGVTFILDSNVSLRGHSDNNMPLISVNKGGTLIMNIGAKISGNTYPYGGGVCVDIDGTFTMKGGEISGNSAYAHGGGVEVYGNFEMTGGKISGNVTDSHAGGVYIGNKGKFTMKGGEISGNSAYAHGGGVEVYGNFEMTGGKISGNTADWAGGVCVDGGTFTMKDGEISGNTASNKYHLGGSGGGVCVQCNGTFTKIGGTIYGFNVLNANRNRAKIINGGHAVHVYRTKDGTTSRREKTAGPGDILDSTKDGKAGGWGI